MRTSEKSSPTWPPSLFFFSDIDDAASGGVESCQGRRFLAFIGDRPSHPISESPKGLTSPLFRQKSIQLPLRTSQTVLEGLGRQLLFRLIVISNSLQEARTILLNPAHHSICCGN